MNDLYSSGRLAAAVTIAVAVTAATAAWIVEADGMGAVRLPALAIGLGGLLLVIAATVTALRFRAGKNRSVGKDGIGDRLGWLSVLLSDDVYGVTLVRAHRDTRGEIVEFTVSQANLQAGRLAGSAVGVDLTSVYGDAIRIARPVEKDIEIRRADGGLRWVRRQIIPLDDELMLIDRDISDAKLTELENRSSHALLQTLMDYIPAVVYAHSMRTDEFGKMVVWNKTAEIVTGYRMGKVIGNNFEDVFPREIADTYADAARRMADDPMAVDLPEQPLRRPDGELRYLREISVPVFNDSGQVEYKLGISEDITARRKQDLALRTKRAELIAANDASPLGLFQMDLQGRCIYINRTCEEMSGLVGLDTIGRGWIELVHPADRWMLLRTWQRTSRKRETFQGAYRFVLPDDRMIWVSLKIAPIVVDGDIKGYSGSADDITSRRGAELAVQESEQHLRTIADTVPAPVAYVGADERYRFTNVAYERSFGVSRDMLRGRTLHEVFGDSLYARVSLHIVKALAGEKVSFEIDEQRNGAYRCIETTYTPQYSGDGTGRIVGFHIMGTDITAKKLHERRLVKMTQIDSLTGLLNRAAFEQKLAEAMAASRAQNALMAVMYLDIDRFKVINDTYGHPVGDALLQSFVGRLVQVLRATDAVSRLGGDEFTVVMENLSDAHDAEAIAAKIRQAMQPPFTIENHKLHVTTSIGLACQRGTDISAHALVRRADDMLYAAKQAGRNTYRVAAIEEE